MSNAQVQWEKAFEEDRGNLADRTRKAKGRRLPELRRLSGLMNFFDL